MAARMAMGWGAAGAGMFAAGAVAPPEYVPPRIVVSDGTAVAYVAGTAPTAPAPRRLGAAAPNANAGIKSAQKKAVIHFLIPSILQVLQNYGKGKRVNSD